MPPASADAPDSPDPDRFSDSAGSGESEISSRATADLKIRQQTVKKLPENWLMLQKSCFHCRRRQQVKTQRQKEQT